MNKGFTLVETLVALTLVLLAVLFGARITAFALAQARQSSLRFRLIETADHYKNYLSSLPFPAPELADGGHRQICRWFVVSWRVEAAAAGLKRITLLAAGPQHALALVFLKSKFILEVRND
jgi:prepilin-type N-terminal cleavage/methylation domain-containing protein